MIEQLANFIAGNRYVLYIHTPPKSGGPIHPALREAFEKVQIWCFGDWEVAHVIL
jgi:hypothetical protein